MPPAPRKRPPIFLSRLDLINRFAGGAAAYSGRPRHNRLLCAQLCRNLCNHPRYCLCHFVDRIAVSASDDAVTVSGSVAQV